MYELPESFKIDCHDDDVLVETLHLMDLMDIRWAGRGEKPSEYVPSFAPWLNVCNGTLYHFMSGGDYRTAKCQEVTFEELAMAYFSEMTLGRDKIKTAFDEGSFVSMLGGDG